MYSFSIIEQLVVFLQAFGLGFIVGLIQNVFDLIFGLFIRGKSKKVLSDIFFCLTFSFVLFCFVLAYNWGKLRLYLLLGLCLGVTIYAFSVGEIISGLFKTLEKYINKGITIASYPFKAMIRGLKKITAKNRHFFMKKLNKSIAKEKESVV